MSKQGETVATLYRVTVEYEIEAPNKREAMSTIRDIAGTVRSSYSTETCYEGKMRVTGAERKS